MKNLISKYWEKILIGICIIIMIIMAIVKFSADKTIIEDYAKYGKDLSVSAGTSLPDDVAGTVTNSGVYNTLTSINPELFKLAMLIIAAILAVVILTSFASMFGGSKDAKKKK